MAGLLDELGCLPEPAGLLALSFLDPFARPCGLVEQRGGLCECCGRAETHG